ncbi:hypothetical protein PSTT_16192 [Puccinia striiformis]|uniref:DUF4218 domain-containing protein n=1 Tax=Puccinia striiformis TaxID=27350 RepID=A0A2S4UED5_9BASI|nr:hypothetical protein PSTT_16192 [Puccinia striiformis]
MPRESEFLAANGTETHQPTNNTSGSPQPKYQLHVLIRVVEVGVIVRKIPEMRYPQIVSPPSSAIPTPSQQVHPPPDGATQTLSDPEITLWKGRTISCGKYAASFYHYFTQIAHPKCRSGVLLAACQYFFLNMSFEVTELKELWTGIKFDSTVNFPKGRIIKVMLGPIICDLPAIRKVLGMAGHSSHKNLCSFCRVTIKKIDRVDLDQSRPRKARVLREQANKWKKADTLDERKEIFQTYGVRYSILYELPYFDPLSSAIVKPMHNIFLGLLKHHGQDLFGLKSFEKKSSKKGCFQRKSPKNCESGSEHLQSSEISGSEDGMEDEEGITAEEAGQEDPQPVDKEHAQPANELLNAFQSLTFATDPEPVSPPVSESESSSSESDSSNVQSFADCEIPTELNPLGAKFFTQKHHLQTLREVNKKFTLPSWIGRVPSTVGSAKGGKLKADEWVILFEIIMIPTLIQLLSEKSGDIFEIGVFKNLLHLTSITNIVRSLEITNDDIDALRIHLKAYRQGLLDLFPSFPTKPNHHYALHLPDCLSQFGPAPQWTAWSFERLNGSLASIPTNNHIGELFQSCITDHL